MARDSGGTMEILAGNTFYEIASLILLAAAVGFLGLLLRQPLVVAFIAAGILAGPVVFGIVDAEDEIQLLAEIGVVLLLFVVGLKLDVRLIRTVGPVPAASSEHGTPALHDGPSTQPRHRGPPAHRPCFVRDQNITWVSV
jgi:hypothetical protein